MWVTSDKLSRKSSAGKKIQNKLTLILEFISSVFIFTDPYQKNVIWMTELHFESDLTLYWLLNIKLLSYDWQLIKNKTRKFMGHQWPIVAKELTRKKMQNKVTLTLEFISSVKKCKRIDKSQFVMFRKGDLSKKQYTMAIFKSFWMKDCQ